MVKIMSQFKIVPQNTTRQTTLKVFYESSDEHLINRFSRIYLKYKREVTTYEFVYYNYKGQLNTYITGDNEFARFLDTVGFVYKKNESKDVTYSIFDIEGVICSTYNTCISDNNKQYLKLIIESNNIENHKTNALKVINNLKRNGFLVDYECKDVVTSTIACRNGD
jgi:hypothetical protein